VLGRARRLQGAGNSGRPAMSRLVRAARKALREVADPGKAPIMQAYMKSAMPYLGIQATPLRKTAKTVFSAHKLESFEEWRDAVLELWRGARYREERYMEIELAGYSTYRKFRTLDALSTRPARSPYSAP